MIRNLAGMIVGCVACAIGAQPPPTQAPFFLIAVGAEGTEEFGKSFSSWVERWQKAAASLNAEIKVIGQADDPLTDRERLLSTLQQTSPSRQPLWLILIGHGTFDRQSAKFNLRGPDISSSELKAAVKEFPRPLVVVNCASSSGPFINDFSGAERVVITATKSGTEDNYARFGDHFSAAIIDPNADIDHDDEVSLLEAFILAAKQTQNFYVGEGRIATEHALLDDNGDSRGTPASFYRGVRVIQASKDGKASDGQFARRLMLTMSAKETPLTEAQIIQRDELEAEIEALRGLKKSLTEDEFYLRLEGLMLKLARLGY